MRLTSVYTRAAAAACARQLRFALLRRFDPKAAESVNFVRAGECALPAESSMWDVSVGDKRRDVLRFAMAFANGWEAQSEERGYFGGIGVAESGLRKLSTPVVGGEIETAEILSAAIKGPVPSWKFRPLYVLSLVTEGAIVDDGNALHITDVGRELAKTRCAP